MAKVRDKDVLKKWQGLIKMQQTSGLTKSVWCREQEIDLIIFYYCQKKIRFNINGKFVEIL